MLGPAMLTVAPRAVTHCWITCCGAGHGAGHLPVVEGVVGCERLSAPPHAAHVLLVEDDTLHLCKGQTPLGIAAVGGCTRAWGRTGETEHMPGDPAHPPSAPCEPNKPNSSQQSCGAACLQRWAPTIPFTHAVSVILGLPAAPHLPPKDHWLSSCPSPTYAVGSSRCGCGVSP